MDVFIILIVVIVSWVYTCVRICQTERYKYMEFIVCPLYLSKAVKKLKRTRFLDVCY